MDSQNVRLKVFLLVYLIFLVFYCEKALFLFRKRVSYYDYNFAKHSYVEDRTFSTLFRYLY